MKSLLWCLLFLSVACNANATPRDYWSEPTHEEEEALYFMIHTLGTSGLWTLASKSSELDKAGSATSNVHPLRAMKYVYTHPQLSKDIQEIGSIAWKRFSHDYGLSFQQEAHFDNMKPEILKDFAESVSLDTSFFDRYVKANDWTSVMTPLRTKLKQK